MSAMPPGAASPVTTLTAGFNDPLTVLLLIMTVVCVLSFLVGITLYEDRRGMHVFMAACVFACGGIMVYHLATR